VVVNCEVWETEKTLTNDQRKKVSEVVEMFVLGLVIASKMLGMYVRYSNISCCFSVFC